MHTAAAGGWYEWIMKRKERSLPIHQREQQAVLRSWATSQLLQISCFLSSNDFKTA